MLTTAKSIQLLDASGMNISPITDITSLYYEVANSSNSNIISRKYVYTGFPVAVNIKNEVISKIGVSTNTSEKRHPEAGLLYENGQFRKVIDGDRNDDILVARVDVSIIPGTTYRQINVTNYNLSEILSYYTPLDLMDASYAGIIEDINIINASIIDISTRATNISIELNAQSCTLQELINLKGHLIPNKFYLINNYYDGDDGCMYLPNNNNFNGPDSDNSLSLLVKAIDTSTLDEKLYEMYDNNSKNILKVIGTYKLENDNTKIHITYMKDKYGNEAPYDFYNLKYKQNYTFGTNLINSSIQNNIIKTDPYTFYKMPIFSQNGSNSNYIIKNNYIGINNNIYIKNSNNIQNNIIYNQNNISIYNSIKLENFVINNNNTFINNTNSDYCNGIIGNNNIINLSTNILSELTINSSNNITLYNNASNVTILNNCNGSINLSNNIVVDNYINTAENASLNTSVNSVYLFGQDIYAKSFNTLR